MTEVTHHTLIREEMRHFFDSFPADAHPMAVLASGTVGMSTFYPDSHEIFEADAVEITINRLIAKLPTLAAWSFKKAIGQPYVYPRNDLGYAANLLHMMFAVPSEDYEVNPEVAKALDLLLILHADHEQNASTSTVRLVGSTHANLYAIDQRRHQRAVGAAARRRERGGHQDPGATSSPAAAAWRSGSTRAKDPDDSFRLAGFGHRVYKNFDPRARIIKRAAERVLEATGADEELFEVAKRLEEVALDDEYFVSRKLYPNVDFYSGLIYRAIGFPKNMFTNCFAIGRLPGWIAQWKEMLAAKETKIGRPRQVYVGPAEPRLPRHRAALNAPDDPRPLPRVAEPRRGLRRLPRRRRRGARPARHRPRRRLQLVRRHHPDELDAVVVSHMHADHCSTSLPCATSIRGARDPRTSDSASSCHLARRTRCSTWHRAWATPGTSRIASDSPSMTVTPHWRSASSRCSRSRRSTSSRAGASASRRDGRRLAYTADTAPCGGLADLADSADLLLSEATLRSLDEDAVAPEPRGHLLPAEAGDAASNGGSRRLMLTHLPVEGDGAWATRSAADAFGGDVEIAVPQRTYEI